MNIITVSVGELLTNCYLVSSNDTKEAMIVDPGDEPLKIIKVIEEFGLKPLFIVNTHLHPDHLRGNSEISNKYGIPVYIGEKENGFLGRNKMVFSVFTGVGSEELKFNKFLKEGDELKVGELKFQVVETPGHSPGGICLYGHESLFSGDTLFAGDVGRVDIPGGSEKKLVDSFKKLLKLPGETKVYPGHGKSTTIKDEKTSNILSMELGLA